jgi:nucleoside-triphosphatase THEP1
MISIIDEIGLLEVSGRGWANCLERLFDRSENHIIITVRDSFVDVVRNKWTLSDITVFDVNDTDFISAGQIILKLIKTGK